MKLTCVSSLVKVRDHSDLTPRAPASLLLRGEKHSYQLIAECDSTMMVRVQVVSNLPVQLYRVRSVPMDFPAFLDRYDDDYLTLTPGLMPDLLEPMEQSRDLCLLGPGLHSFWVQIRVPQDAESGEYPVRLVFTDAASGETLAEYCHTPTVLPVTLPPARLLFTQWFHTDCIAQAYRVDIYSPEHWHWIEEYIRLAADLGINMILTPVITPPLDTAVGQERPNTQLISIEITDDGYRFDFTRLRHWVELCLKYGIRNFEISHLFSQWGAGYAPNIYAQKNGKTVHLFGWHVKSSDPSYRDFLCSLLPALREELLSLGVWDHSWFHISDEPHSDQLEVYKQAKDLVASQLPDARFMDALSQYEFYEQGLVPHPVCATSAIDPFLEKKVPSLWAYYCCGQNRQVGNRFLAMPSYRNRILGLQLFRHRICGFLQWGYNYYNSATSQYAVNPFVTTSGDCAYPSGDPFSVYPGKDGPLPSLRAIIFEEALQDVRILSLWADRIGSAAVDEAIDSAAGSPLTFSEYPRRDDFIPDFIDSVKAELLK